MHPRLVGMHSFPAHITEQSCFLPGMEKITEVLDSYPNVNLNNQVRTPNMFENKLSIYRSKQPEIQTECQRMNQQQNKLTRL